MCEKAENPKQEIGVNLEKQIVTIDNNSYSFEYDPFRKNCLLNGLDDMTYLVEHLDVIKEFEQARG